MSTLITCLSTILIACVTVGGVLAAVQYSTNFTSPRWQLGMAIELLVQYSLVIETPWNVWEHPWGSHRLQLLY